MRIVRDKGGQFIVIAILMVAIMLVSVASIMYSAVTYFRHERWEEYLSVIDTVRFNSRRLVEISLVNFTITNSSAILRSNLDQWQRDLMKAYPGFRVTLTATLPDEENHTVYGVQIYYEQGLATTWNQTVSFSAANATFDVNVTSIGLSGYKFTTPVFLKMNITDGLWYKQSKQVGIRLIIEEEDLAPANNLQETNFVLFRANSLDIQNFTVQRYYSSELESFVYELQYSNPNDPSPVDVEISVVDSRGIKVAGFTDDLSLTDVNA